MRRYYILDVAQGSDEWRRLRLTKFTASKVPALLGLCPYRSGDDVLREMLTGEEEVFSASKLALFRKGHETEDRIRRILENVHRMKLPPVVLQSTAHPMLMASLDGYCVKHNTGLEAKLVGKKKILEIRAGKIPAHHVAQVQAQLLVSGADRFIYAAMDFSGNFAVQEIFPDPVYATRIIECVRSFARHLRGLQVHAEGLLDDEEELARLERVIAIECDLIHLRATEETRKLTAREPYAEIRPRAVKNDRGVWQRFRKWLSAA